MLFSPPSVPLDKRNHGQTGIYGKLLVSTDYASEICPWSASGFLNERSISHVSGNSPWITVSIRSTPSPILDYRQIVGPYSDLMLGNVQFELESTPYLHRNHLFTSNSISPHIRSYIKEF